MSSNVAAPPPPANQDLSILVQLAVVAMGRLGAPLLPDGWALISTFPGNNPPIPGQSGQGFVATGMLPSGLSVTVLALGLPWTTYLGLNPNLSFALAPVRPPIVPAAGPAVETNLLTAYTGMQAALWTAVIAAAGGGPLYITGIGPGGPLAQLAAIDLRPGNKGPGGQSAPTPAPTVAVFSSPGPGNSDFAAAFGQLAGAAATVGLAALGTATDRFPIVPTAAAGTPVTVSARLSNPFDDPWLERGPGVYASALNSGTPWYPPTPSEARITNPPAGFDPLRAAACARLCAAAYMLAQRPGLIAVSPIAPYTLHAVLTANNAVQGAVFVSSMDIVVAFRGAITFFEFVTLLGDSFAEVAPFIDANFFMHAGARVLYTSGSPTSVQAQLFAALATTGTKRPVYYTGHDLGAPVAVLAAADQAANHAAIGAPTVYGFGACQLAGVQMSSSPVYASLNAASFMVARTTDFLPRAPLIGSLIPFGQTVNLVGVPPNDEPTAHGIAGYARLLSPWA